MEFLNHNMNMRTADFDYQLDESLIAQAPSPRRTESGLMSLDRATGRVCHHVFCDISDLLRPGDLLVLNNTAVAPARFFCARRSGGRIEGLFLKKLASGMWEVMLKNAGRCRRGERLTLVKDESVELELVENLGLGRWTVSPPASCDTMELLKRVGLPPLPPYIRRGPEGQPQDVNRYQTVYAQRPGAVAAPTAGLHFTPELLENLSRKGIGHTFVTLHVGMGTFMPVKVDNIAEHTMHEEWYELGTEAVEAINTARAEGRRVVAVGTTSVRVLESAARRRMPLESHEAWTNIFLYPPAQFMATDALITNFHLPKSTLLMLVSAFCQPGGKGGIDIIRLAYAQAIERRYRFFSYGDAMLIE